MSEEIDPWAGDCLDRKKFGDLLLACLQGEAALCDEAFVVALTGKFGAGKSYFLDMWQREIALKRTAAPDQFPLVVRINAWESDFSGEPLLALVAEISTQLAAATRGKGDEAMDELKRGLAVVAGLPQVTVGGWMKGTSGAAIAEFWTEATDLPLQDKLDRRAEALVSEFNARKLSLEKLRDSLRKLIDSRSEVSGDRMLKLILIVDELDRCHPRYAIEFLEAIKHVFNVKGLAVVLGVDWEQLGSTARALFGTNLNAEEYLRKFIKRKAPLPDGNHIALGRLGTRFCKRYFQNESRPSDAWKAIGGGQKTRLLSAIFHALGLSPRQFESAFHLLSSFYQLDDLVPGGWHDRDNYVQEFVVAGLCIGNPELFALISAGEDTLTIMKEIRALGLAKKLREAEFTGDHIEGMVAGGLKTNANYHEFEKLTAEAGYATTADPDSETRYRNFISAARNVRGFNIPLLRGIACQMSNLQIFGD